MMTHIHFQILCTCGRVIIGCRCPDTEKDKKVIKNGCMKCIINPPRQGTRPDCTRPHGQPVREFQDLAPKTSNRAKAEAASKRLK